MELINTRFCDPEQFEESFPPPGTITVVSHNDARENSIKFYEMKFVASLPPISDGDILWRDRGAVLIQADLSLPSRYNISEQEIRARFSSISCNKYESIKKFTVDLCCILGGSYIITENSDVGRGVANGTHATLCDVILHDFAKMRTCDFGSDGMIHAVYCSDV